MNRLYSLGASLLPLAMVTAPNADLADCGHVADRYMASVAGVITALRAYEKCIAHSDERDDCSVQIEALDNAHDNFADAIAAAKDCR